MTRWISLLAAVGLLACGGDDDGGDTSIDPVDAGSTDTEAPELRDLRVTIEGDLGVTLELNSRDPEHIVPGPVEVELTVLARDDQDPVEDLVVELIDASDGVLDAELELRNGLWRVRTSLEPGTFTRVRVSDRAGNTRTSEHGLNLPALDQAIAGDWETWFFDDTQTITHKHTATWNRAATGGEGEWTENRPDSGTTHGGTWTMTGDALEVVELVGGTPERSTQARFHVDPIYFALHPYDRTAGSSGVEGTWERTWQLREPDSGSLELAEEVTETLALTADTWTETRTVIDHRSGSPQTTTTTRSGTWRIELNDNYTEAVGDFLVRQVTSEDGTPVTGAPETWELHVIRAGRLLLSPMLRQ